MRTIRYYPNLDYDILKICTVTLEQALKTRPKQTNERTKRTKQGVIPLNKEN